MENIFSASDIAWATKKGNAQVEGSAFLRQRGGGLGWAPWVGSVGNTGAPIVFNRFEYFRR